MAGWHSDATDDVFDRLDTSENGLSSDEATQRLEEHGKNEIRREESVSPIRLFLGQFNDFLIYLLVVAALVSIGVGFFPGHEPEYVDAALIFLILLANGIFGFVQDYKAEKSIEALKELSSPNATVLRDGVKKTIDAKDIVPGDIVFIEQGDAIPADARVLEASSLETDESALTGESAQVSKHADTLDEDTSLAERDNMVYMNTTAVKGRGKAVVVSAGMETQVGDIATQLAEADDKKSPFQQEVDEMGQRIGYGILAIIAFVAITQYFFTSATNLTIVLVAITLAVAAVPEGLPAVVTLTLALGSKKMLEKNALVRRLPVVESLGSVDVIVTDKTGTLTEDTMTVKKLYFNDEVYRVTGGGTSVDGSFYKDGTEVGPSTIKPLLECGMRCNNAERAQGNNDFFGDPTEVALLVSAAKAGLTKPRDDSREREIPFSSPRKRMTALYADGDSYTAYMKGAPSTVLERCDRIMIDDEEVELTEEKKQAVLEQNELFAKDALRVLGFAYKQVDDIGADEDDIETNMVFLGLQGMIDPPRHEVEEAVDDCRDAGIHVVMATGDNLTTAKAIGEQVGFNPDGAMTGNEVEELSDAELQETVSDVEIFARVSPSHKVRILDALKANRHNVAMTGDGVNDAPALKESDVGIAMGERGTDVAQQASDMILQDDNFVTIRDAIAEGRGIFDNIRKFVSYLLSYNAGEVLLVFFGILLGSLLFPDTFQAGSEALILTPVMLLWINLVTDGLPALALGADPKVDHIMDRPPRGADEPVIDTRMLATILGIGVLMTVTILPFFFLNMGQGQGLMVAQTVAFTALVVFEMIGIQAIRKIYGTPLLSNKWLWIAIAASLVLQVFVLYTPLRRFFEVASLGIMEWMEIGGALAVFFLLMAGLVKLEDYIFGDNA
jgi:Ca2+-transporting ATPase